jgi:hypothetical protein
MVGSLIAGVILFHFIIRPLQEEAADLEVMKIEADLHTLRLLSTGSAAEARLIKESLLQIYVGKLSGRLSKHPGSEYFLWKIREYYKTNSLPIPEDIVAKFDILSAEKPLIAKIYYHSDGTLADHMAIYMDSLRNR